VADPQQAPASRRPVFEALLPGDKAEVLALAADHRGDVLLTLADGSTVTGYVYALEAEACPPLLRLYPRDAERPLCLRWDEVTGLAFTGDDAQERALRVWRRFVERRGLRPR
jgi:hypothetical protein